MRGVRELGWVYDVLGDLGDLRRFGWMGEGLTGAVLGAVALGALGER